MVLTPPHVPNLWLMLLFGNGGAWIRELVWVKITADALYASVGHGIVSFVIWVDKERDSEMWMYFF